MQLDEVIQSRAESERGDYANNQYEKNPQPILQWHPSFNVYVFENKDVFLLSESAQWLLPQAQFPLLDQINEVKPAGAIIQNACVEGAGVEDTCVEFKNPEARFHQQAQQLLNSNILVNTKFPERYAQPDFNPLTQPYVYESSVGSVDVKIINFSVLKLCDVIKPLLMKTSQELRSNALNLNRLNYLLVDDFLDPRISQQALIQQPLRQQKRLQPDEQVVVLKLSGDAVWISPVYSGEGFHHFEKLQQRILNNQPVRKAAMRKWPERLHSFPVPINQGEDNDFFSEHGKTIAKLIVSQFVAEQSPCLMVYQKANRQVEHHPINHELNNNEDMARQFNTPLTLSSCVNRFNQDGGSRSVAPEETVKRLQPLVSPITGVINHLREVNTDSGSPVKVYRTGFFKTPATLTPQVMEQGFVQICMGKGVEPFQSQASALCETVERYCALYQEDIPLIKARESELNEQSKRTISYQALVPYSPNQYRNFSDVTHPDSTLKQASVQYQNESIHWLPTWSLTQQEQVYVPLSQCFSQLPFEDERYGRWHSNGCAAGNTIEEAILQGLFELIERDAVAIWWYNRLVRPEYDLSQINPENLARLNETLSPKDKAGHEFWVLDLTMDVGVPVMAAIGKDRLTGGFVMGFGCHLRADIAAQRALTELCQLIPIRNQNGAPFDFDAMEEGDYLYPNVHTTINTKTNTKINAPSCQPLSTQGLDIQQDVMALVDRLDLLGLETLVLNYSRAQIPLKTVKVFVPGLCHIWPQLANERLYKTPVALGILQDAYSESELNPQSLYI